MKHKQDVIRKVWRTIRENTVFLFECLLILLVLFLSPTSLLFSFDFFLVSNFVCFSPHFIHLHFVCFFILNQDSAVCITTGYRLDDGGFGVQNPIGVRFFSSPRRPNWFWDQRASYPIDIATSFLGGKSAGA
jgi:hypothetical protein